MNADTVQTRWRIMVTKAAFPVLCGVRPHDRISRASNREGYTRALSQHLQQSRKERPMREARRRRGPRPSRFALNHPNSRQRRPAGVKQRFRIAARTVRSRPRPQFFRTSQFFWHPRFSGSPAFPDDARCTPPLCALRRHSMLRRFGIMSDLQTDIAKGRPDDMVHLRLPADLRSTVERQAAQQHRTLSGQLRFLIAIGIEAQAGPQHRETPR
jgi:hypothetical protein